MHDAQPVKIAIVYYSQTGVVHRLAEAAGDGARAAGADVRLRRVRELAPAEAIDSKPEWRAHLEATTHVPEAVPDDLVWADGVLLGTPTRYGSISSQLQQFIDITGPVWMQGLLADKAYAAFTASLTAHGGQESTLLSLAHVFTHWGGVLVPPGYTDGIQFEVGNPYGASFFGPGGVEPDASHLEAARYLARRVTTVAGQLVRGRSAA